MLSACGPGVDVSKATCETIDQFRVSVAMEYGTSMRTIGDAFQQARDAMQQELIDCRAAAWKGNVCDEQWNALQQSYQNAMGDVSNDDAYNDYKAKKEEWEKCHNNFDEEYKEYEKEGKAKEEACQKAFEAKLTQAIAAQTAAEQKATSKKDADLAALAALEEKCKEPIVEEGGTEINVGGHGVNGGTTAEGGSIGDDGGAVTGGGGGGTIPGENGTPRRGKSSDFGPKDIAINLATTVAEDVTGTPIPTGAINDQIFAGIVCTKLYARIIELQGEESDAIWSNNRAAQIRLRKKIARYKRAKAVWCSIAEGRKHASLIKEEVKEINAMPTGACTNDEECGSAYCSADGGTQQWKCNTEVGSCALVDVPCGENLACVGFPASCVAPPKKIEAIQYGGTYLPLDQIHSYTGDKEECGGKAHWHPNGGNAIALNGTGFSDPDSDNCGFGKVSDLPVVEVEVPGGDTRIEVMMGI